MSASSTSVADERRDGQDFHVLREPASGSEAWVLPAVGASCVHFATTVDGQPLEVIRLPESWDAFVGHPTLWGAGVLFPFPGRIRKGKFHFGDQDHQLPLNDQPAGNAIHGCVSRAAWRPIARRASPEGGASVTYQIGMDQQPDLANAYPFPFRLTMTIRLRGGQLGYAFLAENLGSQPMPIGLGLHPYFPLPLGGVGTVDECEIWVDAPYYWEQEGHMPIGKAQPVESAVDLRVPRSLRALASVGLGGSDRMLNVVHGQFPHAGGPGPTFGGVRSGVRNPRADRAVVVTADSAFPVAVTYIPPSRDKVSFEPHTCLPNAFNLASAGVTAGRITLGPGEFWRGTINIGGTTCTSASS
jgi:aldose 1-epimerase